MARFDLNLLSALNALLSCQHVTKAAEQIHVTQSTMSGMLQRLRYQFDDQLLVRNGRDLELTPFAASLVDPVREALRSIEILVHTEPVFDPATSRREFSLMASDYCESVFLPRVIAYVAEHAPNVRLIMNAINHPVEHLFSGEIDLTLLNDTISPFHGASFAEKIQSEHLFSDEFVCVVAKDHPLDENSSLEQLFNYPHVGAQLFCSPSTLEAAWVKSPLPGYKPNFVVAEFSVVPRLVANSRMVGIIHARMAEIAGQNLAIRTFRSPFEIPRLSVAMMWHSRRSEDPAHVWFRSVMRNVAADWLAESAASPSPSA